MPSRPPAPTSVLLTSGHLSLELVATGATVRRLDVVASGTNVVLGHQDPASYAALGGYLGATIGRFGNRLDGGSFAIDGERYRVVPNEGGNALHGGVDGFDRREWSLVHDDGSSASFRLVSPDGDQGFPGRLETVVTYTVEGPAVRIDYAARTDRTTALNLTNHTYFNLTGEASGPVDTHRLAVHADAYTPTRADLVPTGEVRDVAGTAFDWRTPYSVGAGLLADDEQLEFGRGLDHNFACSGSGLRPVAALTAPSGLRLAVESDQPGLQVYTGAHFDGRIVGTSGVRYGPRAGIALETQGFPDAPNHPTFPSTVLRPGETFRSTTIWRLDRTGPT